MILKIEHVNTCEIPIKGLVEIREKFTLLNIYIRKKEDLKLVT